MSQLSPLRKSSRSVTRAHSLTTSTALVGLALLSSSPVQAQVIGRIGSRSSNSPSAPQPITSLPVYQQPRQSYPQGQPPSPQSYPNSAPVFARSSAPVYRPGPGGSGTLMPSPQTPFSPPVQYRPLPPNVTFRTRSTAPGMGGNAGNDDNPYGQSQRFYSNQLRRPVTPRQAPVQPGGVQVRTYEPIYNHRNDRSVRVTTPIGQQSLPYQDYGSNYIYSPVTIVNGPSLLGGYYYGNYSNTYYANSACFPSIYSCYPGFPQYIVNPGVIVISQPYYPVYATPYQPFDPPAYEVTYNQTNYYVTNEGRAQQVQDGGESARRAIKSAYPEGSYQAAFSDIQKAWKTNDIGLLRKHTRDTDTTLSVYFKGKYSYSIASGDFVKITRDAFDRLSTTSFDFTRLRKAKNGDVTAYGKHVYQGAGSVDTSGDGASADNTVPFDADGPQGADSGRPYDKANDPVLGAEKTIYVSYTLRKHDDQWYIIGIDSSPTDLVK